MAKTQGAKGAVTPFGRLVRYRRRMLGISQEQLASRAEVSTRHLSFVETGRSTPSRELVTAVACALEVDDIGLFLEAAGYLAPYSALELAPEAKNTFERELRAIVDRQLHPALIHDRFGTIHHHNARLGALVGLFSNEAVASGASSGHRLLAALRPYVVNWDQVAALYRRRLFRELVRGATELTDDVLEALYAALEGPDARNDAHPQPLVPLVLTSPERTLRFDFVTVTLGTPQDIALRNFRLVLFLPADEATAAVVAG